MPPGSLAHRSSSSSCAGHDGRGALGRRLVVQAGGMALRRTRSAAISVTRPARSNASSIQRVTSCSSTGSPARARSPMRRDGRPGDAREDLRRPQVAGEVRPRSTPSSSARPARRRRPAWRRRRAPARACRRARSRRRGSAPPGEYSIATVLPADQRRQLARQLLAPHPHDPAPHRRASPATAPRPPRAPAPPAVAVARHEDVGAARPDDLVARPPRP